MTDELDLIAGDEAAADEADTRGNRRRARRAAKPEGEPKPKSSPGRPTARQRLDTELESRLVRIFDRIADTLERRQDPELADAVREEKEAMAGGFVSLTRNVTPLRMPLLMILNLVEPLLAFGKVLSILLGRWQERRIRIMEERQAEQGQQPGQFEQQAAA